MFPFSPAPPYHGAHRVVAANWSYADTQTALKPDGSTEEEVQNERNLRERFVDLSEGAPPYTEIPVLIEKIPHPEEVNT